MSGLETVCACGHKACIPRLGRVVLKESFDLPEGVRVLRATVREIAGRWYVTLALVEDAWIAPAKREARRVAGIDLGLGQHLAILSTGEKVEHPRWYRAAERRLARLQRVTERRRPSPGERGSNRYQKAKQAVARHHKRIADRRNDFIHKLTTNLVETQDVIVVETLNVKGMASGGYRLGKSVGDAAPAEFIRQLQYKSEWNGVTLVEADQWFPSSKTCSACGAVKKDLRLSDREWACVAYGTVHDRDLNAATNLANLYDTTGGSPVAARGGIGVLAEPAKRELHEQMRETGGAA